MILNNLALMKWCVLFVKQAVQEPTTVNTCQSLTPLHTDWHGVYGDNLIKCMGEEGWCACVYVCVRDTSGSVFWNRIVLCMCAR